MRHGGGCFFIGSTEDIHNQRIFFFLNLEIAKQVNFFIYQKRCNPLTGGLGKCSLSVTIKVRVDVPDSYTSRMFFFVWRENCSSKVSVDL